jgi:hypothetical protein
MSRRRLDQMWVLAGSFFCRLTKKGLDPADFRRSYAAPRNGFFGQIIPGLKCCGALEGAGWSESIRAQQECDSISANNEFRLGRGFRLETKVLRRRNRVASANNSNESSVRNWYSHWIKIGTFARVKIGSRVVHDPIRTLDLEWLIFESCDGQVKRRYSCPPANWAAPTLLASRRTQLGKVIRVLVANRPRLMRELILTTFADQPDIEIVGEVGEESEISERIKRTQPDFVVITLDQAGTRPPICDDLFREHPEVRVIAVAEHKNSVIYYWATLDIHSNDIEASEEGILNAMRSRMVANEAM